MDNKYYILLSINNILRRKKGVVLNIFILTMALVLLVSVQVVTRGLDQFINQQLYESINFRTVYVVGDKEDTYFEERMSKELEDNEHISEVYYDPSGATARLKDKEKLENREEKKGFGYISLQGKRKVDDEFIVLGRTINQGDKNVGIVPQYFLPDTSFVIDYEKEDDVFIEGESLIGKNITVIYESRDYTKEKLDVNKSFEYTFEVIGTYDMVPAEYYPYNILIPFKDMEEIVTTLEENNVGLSQNTVKTYSIIIDKQENVQNIMNQLARSGFFTMRKAAIGPIGDIALIINSVGTFLTVLTSGVSLLNITLTVINDIKKRVGEIGLLKAMGYKNKQIIGVLLVEIVIIGIISCIISLGICMITVGSLEYFKTNNMGMYYQDIAFQISFLEVIQLMIGSFIIPIVGSLMGVGRSLRITPKNAIIQGCD